MPVNRVLLVDDEEDIRTIGKLALEDVGGLDVHLGTRGTELLPLVRAHAPDLVLLDVMMPEMDGPTALRQLRESGDETPVIFMTAKVQSREKSSYLDLGAIGVIVKPFDPMTLAADVRALVEK
jgi:DNA-binding response OmpR family regulator